MARPADLLTFERLAHRHHISHLEAAVIPQVCKECSYAGQAPGDLMHVCCHKGRQAPYLDEGQPKEQGFDTPGVRAVVIRGENRLRGDSQAG